MMRLLLVDDDIFLRDMYSLKFSKCGFEVQTASGAGDALRILDKDQGFDIILLDMIMPAMSGTELIKTVRKEFPKMKAKCVVLSNQGQPEDIEGAMAAGADGYIIKAKTIPSEVVAKVESILK